MQRQPSRTALWGTVGVVGSVVSITVLHYTTSVHSVLPHEVFQRLYYLPIVVAAVLFGYREALATSVLASVLYVPHIVLSWHAWPALQLAIEAFDPFPECGNGHGLSLAVARRLIENQGGSARAEAHGAILRYIVDLPLQPLPPAAQHVVEDKPPAPARSA